MSQLKKDVAELQSRYLQLQNELISHRRRTNSALEHSYTFVRRRVFGDKDIYEASDGSSEFTEPLEDLYLQNLNISYNSATADNQAGEKAELPEDLMMDVETVVIED